MNNSLLLIIPAILLAFALAALVISAVVSFIFWDWQWFWETNAGLRAFVVLGLAGSSAK